MFSNGDVKTGKWENGKQHGEGRIVSANGDIKEGKWLNDLQLYLRPVKQTKKNKNTITHRHDPI